MPEELLEHRHAPRLADEVRRAVPAGTLTPTTSVRFRPEPAPSARPSSSRPTGQPNESIAAGGSTTLTDAGDISANSNGALACTNMKTVAANAKAQGILIVTVAYNLKRPPVRRLQGS